MDCHTFSSSGSKGLTLNPATTSSLLAIIITEHWTRSPLMYAPFPRGKLSVSLNGAFLPLSADPNRFSNSYGAKLSHTPTPFGIGYFLIDGAMKYEFKCIAMQN